MLDAFHFQQPLWLACMLPLGIVLWLVKRRQHSNNAWQKLIDEPLRPLLLTQASGKSQPALLWLLAAGWLLTTIALANPRWEHQPRPVFQTDTARIIVLDLSRSMDIADLKPSRLARAKFKAEDILTQQQEGLLGLVVFAGDAFTVTPLSRDNDTLRALLGALTTQMMPAQGSRADLGLLKAAELFKQAGLGQGQVLLIADGAVRKQTLAAARELLQQGYTTSVLGIGTPVGGPIPDLRDAQDKPIVVPLQVATLKQTAKAGGGLYRHLQSTDQDIQDLFSAETTVDDKSSQRSDDLQHQDWKSEGPLLALLLLPLAAVAFRRGWLLAIGFAVITLTQPDPLMASPLDRLWLRSDQRADQALREGHYEQAQQLAQDPLRKGSAAYRQGQFEQAIDAFSQRQGSDAHYNRGNALARMGQLEAAIKAYDEALQQQPGMADATSNRAKVQALLDQQKQENQDEKGDGENQEQDSSSKDQQGKDGESQQNESSQQNDSGDDASDRQQENAASGEPASENKDPPGEPSDPGQDPENQFADANKALDKDQDAQQESVQEQPDPAPSKDSENKEQSVAQQASQEADDLNTEEKLAAEQWLNRIPDDPGGLMRRKFQYQYQQRQHPAGIRDQPPW